MQKEAEAHAEDDRKAKEAIELRNNADNLAYQSEKQLKELGDKVPADQKAPVEEAITKLRDALKGSDDDAVKKAFDDLNEKFQAISAKLYEAAAAAQQAGAEAGPGPGPQPEAAAPKKDADVVDAEFEMVDEDKKKS